MILLYPGDREHSGFKAYKNIDHDVVKHECMMGFVSVLNGELLNKNIGENILQLLLEK